MIEKRTINEQWYVIFTESGYKSWFMNILRDDYRHVYAMKKSKGDYFWLIVNPTRTHIDVSQELVSDYPHPRAYAGDNAIILPVLAKINRTQTRGMICHMNCVEVIKGLLGIKSFWTFTPWQLYKYITKGQ